jgi:acyl CoA:acetate/3-ketoacid CoA transferase beta subunit
MDISTLTATQAQQQQQVVTDTATLKADQALLDATTAELAQATLVNDLEALTEADVATVNAALLADGTANSLGISLALAQPPAVIPGA